MGNELNKEDLVVGVKKRSWFSRRLLFVSVLFLVFFVVMFYFCFVPSRLVVSPETTFVTEHLTPEGLPDYLAAYLEMNNAQLKNPEDNGYRLVLEAFGPYVFDKREMMKTVAWEDLPADNKYGKWYKDTWVPLCKAMSIDPTKKPKEYTSVYEFYNERMRKDTKQDTLENREKLFKMLKELGSKPWRTEDNPEVAELLDKSAEALDLFSFAAKKSIWVCYRSHNGSLKPLWHPDLGAVSAAYGDLVIRIGKRLGENDVAGALDDAFTIIRLARHYKNHYTSYEHLSSFAMEAVGMKSLQVILANGNLNSDQIHQLIKEFDSLPKHEDTFEKVIQFEKLVYLETILSPLKYEFLKGDTAYENLNGGGFILRYRDKAIYQSYIQILLELPVDFNYAARRGLFRWRSLESIAKEKDIQKRWELLQEHYEEAKATHEQIFDLRVISLTPFIQIRSQVFADIVFNKYGYAGVFSRYAKREKEIVTIHNMFYVSSALELYQHDNGNYPNSLDTITPKYLDKIPIDQLSTDNKFTYKKTDTGYILYSFGIDEKDDGGEEKGKGGSGEGDIVVERKR
ncbi:MAG: hypothetical protein LBQ66_14045 [Planctomycetaceae bacterium]|jgi:hypothetical protein|nr:hypothetical protein [Planctomycetaceae bacterium]